MQTTVRSTVLVHCVSLRCESKILRSVNVIGLVISPSKRVDLTAIWIRSTRLLGDMTR